MDKIEVGEWVRTKKGQIDKFEKLSGEEDDIVVCKKKRFWLEDIVKHSKNKIELLEDGDFVELEYKSPKYRERITRVFEVSIVDKYTLFENYYCNFFYKKGDKKITDKICKNIKLKSVLTHEQFESRKYYFEEE